MNFFTIFAHGESFDVDAFLSKTSLTFDHIWHRGDLRDHPFVKSKHPTSGVEIVLGDGLTIPFLKQERIAIDYIKDNKEDLKYIGMFPGVKTFILGLQYRLEIAENINGFCMGPSEILMQLALEIGFYPNYYVTIDRNESSVKKRIRRLKS